MKGESRRRDPRLGPLSPGDAEAVAIAIFRALVGVPERAAAFMSAGGLDPGTIRRASADPGFLAAVLDHVAADENLLLDLSGDTGIPPERIMAARRLLSPEAEWSP